MIFALRPRTTGSILIKTAVRSGLRRNRRCGIHGVLIPLDPSLTLTRTQCSAIVSNRENRNPLLMRELQACAMPSNPRPHTRNEIRSAVRVRSPALYNRYRSGSLQCRLSPGLTPRRHRGTKAARMLRLPTADTQ